MVAALAEQERMSWDTSGLTTTYCTLGDVRERDGQIEISFGVSRKREQSDAELEVQLLHRIVLDPTAATRLQELLIKLIEDQQSRKDVAR
jgi:hypothetical protein